MRMIDCIRNTELVSRALDEPLAWQERAQVRMHLVGCVGCRRWRRQVGLLHDATRRWAAGEGPPGEPADERAPGSR